METSTTPTSVEETNLIRLNDNRRLIFVDEKGPRSDFYFYNNIEQMNLIKTRSNKKSKLN